jgi:tetratricopeptide (TPR) repeat protein
MVGGCIANGPEVGGLGRGNTTVERFIEARAQRAVDLEREGRLRAALEEWRIVDSVAHGRHGAAEEILRLEALIVARLQELRSVVHAADSRGDVVASRSAALRVLALDPADTAAADRLRAWEQGRRERGLAAAPGDPDGSYGLTPQDDAINEAPADTATERTPTATEDGLLRRGRLLVADGDYPAALEWLSEALRLRPEPSGELAGMIGEVSRRVAQLEFERGVAAFREGDYRRAAGAFKRALNYQPDHSRAALYLRSAERLAPREP